MYFSDLKHVFRLGVFGAPWLTGAGGWAWTWIDITQYVLYATYILHIPAHLKKEKRKNTSSPEPAQPAKNTMHIPPRPPGLTRIEPENKLNSASLWSTCRYRSIDDNIHVCTIHSCRVCLLTRKAVTSTWSPRVLLREEHITQDDCFYPTSGKEKRKKKTIQIPRNPCSAKETSQPVAVSSLHHIPIGWFFVTHPDRASPKPEGQTTAGHLCQTQLCSWRWLWLAVT